MRVNNPFKDLTIDKLDEQKFVGNFNAKLQEAIQSVLDYIAKYGDRAKPTKASLSVKIDVLCAPSETNPKDPEQATWMVVIKPMDVKRPSEHPIPAIAICARGEDGKTKLFVQASGARNESPEQFRITTDDGRAVDPATGEISEELTDHVVGPRAMKIA